jgi:hypothetical protein
MTPAEAIIIGAYAYVAGIESKEKRLVATYYYLLMCSLSGWF